MHENSTANIRLRPEVRAKLDQLRWPRSTYSQIVDLLIAWFLSTEPGENLRAMRELALRYANVQEVTHDN